MLLRLVQPYLFRAQALQALQLEPGRGERRKPEQLDETKGEPHLEEVQMSSTLDDHFPARL